MDRQTGMSVNLTLLDDLMAHIFKNSVCRVEDPLKFLQQKVFDLKRELLKSGTQLVSVQFSEARNFGILFVTSENTSIELIRHDLAEAANRDMYKIISYFNQGEQLTKIELLNLRTNVSEQINF